MADTDRPAAASPAAGPRWRGLPRRHPASVTAQRIRAQASRYRLTGREQEQLAQAAEIFDRIAVQEPNR